MEKIRAVYLPEPEPEFVQGYLIRDRSPVGGKVFVLGHNPNAPQPYVTWQGYQGIAGYDWGHYFSTYSDASDFFLRADAERRGISYKPTVKQTKLNEKER
jgi:hypothetical protein